MSNDILKNLAAKANTGTPLKPTDMVTTMTVKDLNTNRYPTHYAGVSNQEEIYARNQSVASKYTNGLVKGLGLTATTFLGGTVGLVNGVYSWAATGEFDKFYDNTTNNSLSSFSKSMEDWFPNYYTQSERDAKWYSPDTWLTANFWSDTILKNLGFAAGAYFSGGVVTSGVTAGARAINGLAKSLGAVKNTQTAAELAKVVDQSGFATRLGSTISSGVESAGATIANTTNRIAGPTAWREWGKNLTHSVLSAAGEASIESLHAKNDYKDKLVEEFKKNTGRAPDENQMKEIEDVATNVGNTVFGANMAILTMSNVMMFPALSKPARAESGVITGSERKALLNVADADGNIIQRSWRPNQKLSVNTAKGETLVASNQSTGIGNIIEAYKAGKVINRVSPIAKMMFAPSEALEEGAQTYSAIAAEAYFDKGSKTKGDLWNTLQSSFHEALEQKDFWVALMSGGISGGMMQNLNPLGGRMFGGFRDRKDSIANSNKIANELNSAGVASYVTELARSVARNEALTQEARVALDNGDISAYEDRKWDSIINYLTPKIMYGRKELVDQDVENWKELARTEEGWSKVQEFAGITEGMTREEFTQGLDKVQQTANKMSEVFEGLNVRYGNSRDVNGNKTHSPEVISKLAYLATKLDIRNTEVTNKMTNLMNVGLDVAGLTSFMQSNEVSEENPFTIMYPDGTTFEAKDKSSDTLRNIYTTFVNKAIDKLSNDSSLTSDQIEDVVLEVESLIDNLANRKYEVDLYEDISKNPYNYNETYEDATIDDEDVVVGDDGLESTIKHDFYVANEGTRVLLNFGTRGEKSGVIRYNPEEDILAVEMDDGSLYEVTNDDFKSGLARMEDPEISLPEDFLNMVDPRIVAKGAESRALMTMQVENLRERLSSRGKLIDTLTEKLGNISDLIVNHPNVTMKEYSDLVSDLRKRVDKILASASMRRANKDFEEGKITPEELAAIEKDIREKEGIPELESRIAELDKTMPTYEGVSETIEELNEMKAAVEAEIQAVEEESVTLEEQISQYDEMLGDPLGDYNYVLNELEEQIFNLEDGINALRSQKSKLESLLGKISNAIVELAESIRNSAKINPTAVSPFIINAAEVFVAGGPVENFIASLKGKTDKLSMLTGDRVKVQQALDEVNERLKQLEDEMADKFELWDKLIDVSEKIHHPVNPAYFTQVENPTISSAPEDTSETEMVALEDSEITTNEVAKFFNGAKKILSRLFKSTIVMPDMQNKPAWYKRYETAVQNMALTSWEERSSHRVMLITANNEASVGLTGLVDSMTQGQFTTAAERVDKHGGAILAVLVRENTDGTTVFLDENLQPISSPTIDNVVATKMPTPAIAYSKTGEVNHSKPETVSVTPDELSATYTNLREQILSEKDASRTHLFFLSRGQLPTNDSENTIVGNLIPGDNLSATPLLEFVRKGETITSEDGESFTPSTKAVLFLRHEGTFTPVYVSRFKPAARRGLMFAINHVRVNAESGVDERYLTFLQKLLPVGMKYNVAKDEITFGKQTFNVNRPNFEKEFLPLLERTKPNINHDMMAPFDEVQEDGTIRSWSTFQEFLLSIDNRSALVHTNIASKKLQHRYMILKNFFDDHRSNSGVVPTAPDSPTHVRKNMIESLAESSNMVDKDKLKTFLRNIAKHKDLIEDILEVNKVITKYDC